MNNGKSRHRARLPLLAALVCWAGLAFAAPAAWAALGPRNDMPNGPLGSPLRDTRELCVQSPGLAGDAAGALVVLADSRCRDCKNRRSKSYDTAQNEAGISGKSAPADPAIPRYDPKPLSPRDEYRLRVFEATQDRLNNPDYNDTSAGDAAGGEAPADSQEAKDPNAADAPSDGSAGDGSQAQAQGASSQDQQKAKGKKKQEPPPPPPEKSGGFKMIVIEPQGGRQVIKPQD